MNKAPPLTENRHEDGAAAQKPERVSVLFPMPLPKAYDYACDGDVPPLGSFVTAPFGPREVAGVVWPSEGEAPPLES